MTQRVVYELEPAGEGNRCSPRRPWSTGLICVVREEEELPSRTSYMRLRFEVKYQNRIEEDEANIMITK